jgi:hypothetical protein
MTLSSSSYYRNPIPKIQIPNPKPKTEKANPSPSEAADSLQQRDVVEDLLRLRLDNTLIRRMLFATPK